jgi:hypothetical protein
MSGARREYRWAERLWYVVSPLGCTVATVQGPAPEIPQFPEHTQICDIDFSMVCSCGLWDRLAGKTR